MKRLNRLSTTINPTFCYFQNAEGNYGEGPGEDPKMEALAVIQSLKANLGRMLSLEEVLERHRQYIVKIQKNLTILEEKITEHDRDSGRPGVLAVESIISFLITHQDKADTLLKLIAEAGLRTDFIQADAHTKEMKIVYNYTFIEMLRDTIVKLKFQQQRSRKG